MFPFCPYAVNHFRVPVCACCPGDSRLDLDPFHHVSPTSYISSFFTNSGDVRSIYRWCRSWCLQVRMSTVSRSSSEFKPPPEVTLQKFKDRIAPQVNFFQQWETQVEARRGRKERQRRWGRIDKLKTNLCGRVVCACRQVEELCVCMWKGCVPRKTKVDVTKCPPSAPSATPNAVRCRQVPRLPRKTKVDVSNVTKCHACHAKCRGAATQNEGECEQAPRLPQLCVKDGVWQTCVCVRKLCCVCVRKLCVTMLCVIKLCVKESVWQCCVWQSCVWKRVCDKGCVWARCVWQCCV